MEMLNRLEMQGGRVHIYNLNNPMGTVVWIVCYIGWGL